MIRSRVNVYLSSKLEHLRVKGHALNNYIDKHKLGIMFTCHYIYIMSNFPKGNEESRRILNRKGSVTCAFKKPNFDRKENVTYVKLKEGNWLGGRRLF